MPFVRSEILRIDDGNQSPLPSGATEEQVQRKPNSTDNGNGKEPTQRIPISTDTGDGGATQEHTAITLSRHGVRLG